MTKDFEITASVGEDGVNNLEDLRLVQMLLNRIEDRRGGPNPRLVADGLIGRKTIAVKLSSATS